VCAWTISHVLFSCSCCSNIYLKFQFNLVSVLSAPAHAHTWTLTHTFTWPYRSVWLRSKVDYINFRLATRFSPLFLPLATHLFLSLSLNSFSKWVFISPAYFLLFFHIFCSHVYIHFWYSFIMFMHCLHFLYGVNIFAAQHFWPPRFYQLTCTEFYLPVPLENLLSSELPELIKFFRGCHFGPVKFSQISLFQFFSGGMCFKN